MLDGCLFVLEIRATMRKCVSKLFLSIYGFQFLRERNLH